MRTSWKAAVVPAAIILLLLFSIAGPIIIAAQAANVRQFSNSTGPFILKATRIEWHNITAWGKLAEICGQYLRKGKLVYIEGSIRTDSWDDKESGQKRYRTEIVANTMKMLDRKGDENGGGGSYAGAARKSSGAATQVEEDDDVPF